MKIYVYVDVKTVSQIKPDALAARIFKFAQQEGGTNCTKGIMKIVKNRIVSEKHY